MQIFSDRIIWDRDDFLGGMSPDVPTAVTNIRHLGNGYAYARAFNPLQTVPGVAYPGKNAINLTNVPVLSASFPDHVLTTITTLGAKSSAYGLGGSKLHKLTTSSDTLVNTGSFPHTITATSPTHASHTGINRDPLGANFRGNHYNSVVEAHITTNSVTTNAILYSWYDTTDWDVGFYDPDENIQFLDYDAESAAFTAGETLTGGTSSATATIEAVADDGSTGTLMLSGVSGTFQDNENITDSASGDATSNGTATPFQDDYMSRFVTNKLGTVAADLTNGADMGHPIFFSRHDENHYIASGKHVHKFDPTTNTFTSQALTLPEGFIIKGFVETQYDLIVFADKRLNGLVPALKSEAYAFFWSEDRPTTYYKSVNLNDDFVGGSFSKEGLVGCFTGFNDGVGNLQLLDGGSFRKIAQFEGSDSADLPSESGVDVQDNIIMWNAGGIIWAYGRYRNKLQAGVHPISQYGDESGFLKVLSGSNIYVSGGDLAFGAAKLNQFNTNTKVTLLSATPRFKWGFVGSITGVQVRYFNSVSGGLEVDAYLNVDETSHKFIDTQSDTSDRVYSYTNKTDGSKFPTFTEIAPRIDWPSVAGDGSATISPGIVDITVFYEPTPITNN